jgi:hypothetical protein
MLHGGVVSKVISIYNVGEILTFENDAYVNFQRFNCASKVPR